MRYQRVSMKVTTQNNKDSNTVMDLNGQKPLSNERGTKDENII